MALELEGTLRQKLGVQSGTSARGIWAKQEFILEYPDGNFTAQACFTAWGQDKVAEMDKYQVGDRIKVSFNLKSREYNGRWYNDLQIWRIAPAGQTTEPAPEGNALPGAFARTGSRSDAEGKVPSSEPSASSRIHVADTSALGLPEAVIRIACSKGTYIRAFARDLGEALGSGAHLSGLIRSRSGDYPLSSALTLGQALSLF